MCGGGGDAGCGGGRDGGGGGGGADVGGSGEGAAPHRATLLVANLSLSEL